MILRDGPTLLLSVFLAGALAPPTAAQEGAAGSLRGSVVDADFGNAVPGVSVTVEGLGLSATSDGDGIFLFERVPARGAVTLVAGREGYVATRRGGVGIVPGRLNEVTLEITADVFELDEFVVPVEDLVAPESLGAIGIQRSLDNIAVAISADDLSKSGASDVGQALKGVSGTSTAGGGRFVVVRGLADRYNTVVLNGMRIPSSDPDRRAVNVDIFPSSIVGNLVTSKTFSPDIPGESTGGYIDIQTTGVPQKPFFKLSLGTGYNTNATGNRDFVVGRGPGIGIFGTEEERELPAEVRALSETDLSTTATTRASTNEFRARVARTLGTDLGVDTREPPLDFSLRASAGTSLEFFGRPLGIVGAVSYSKRHRSVNRGQIGRSVLQGNSSRQIADLEFSEGTSELLAALLFSASWEATDNSTIKATYFNNVAAQDTAFFQVGPHEVFAGDDIDTPDARLFVREGSVYNERHLWTAQLSGEHILNDSEGVPEFRWGTAYSQSSENQPDLQISNYVVNPIGPRYAGVQGEFAGEEFERSWRRFDDDNFFLHLDADIPLASEGEKEVRAKLGASWDRSSREARFDRFGYSGEGGFRAAGTPPLSTLGPGDGGGQTFGDILGELDQTPTGRRDRLFLFRSGPPSAYVAEQQLLSGYLDFSADLTEGFSINGGARVERFTLSGRTEGSEGGLSGAEAANVIRNLTSGQLLPPEAIGRANIPISEAVRQTFTGELPRSDPENRVLPAISFNWDFAENMRLRGATSRTVARPSFKEVVPVATRNPGENSLFFGNPALLQSDINNYDVRWEWFPEPKDLIAFGVFAKTIDRPIELNTTNTFEFFTNAETGTLYGAELEVSKNLGIIDDFFEPFTVSGNYALIVSSVRANETEREQRRIFGLPQNRRLQGQPDYTLNFNVTYDNTDYGVFAGLFLNVTGQSLSRVGSGGTDDIFERPRTTLNFALSKQLTDTWKLTLRANNLTGSASERFYRNGDPFEIEDGGTSYSLGLSGTW